MLPTQLVVVLEQCLSKLLAANLDPRSGARMSFLTQRLKLRYATITGWGYDEAADRLTVYINALPSLTAFSEFGVVTELRLE